MIVTDIWHLWNKSESVGNCKAYTGNKVSNCKGGSCTAPFNDMISPYLLLLWTLEIFWCIEKCPKYMLLATKLSLFWANPTCHDSCGKLGAPFYQPF